ncbi:MAG: SCO1664 family protein [Anaerolinea sp.]|nr:SCO1664 family protein [Anaerolinea sp.]
MSLQDNNPQRLPLERVAEVMEQGDVDNEHGILRWSSNYAFLVSLKLENDAVNAVYKPQRGERPLWDFPDGTLCYRETAAYLTSKELCWELVPPTVLREGPRGLGSFQFFIDHDPQVNYFSFDETMMPQLKRMAAFDYVVNNADRKGGHCLVDCDGHLWGIDHGITFNAVHKLRTVIWDFAGQSISEPLLADIARLCAILEDPTSTYTQTMHKLLSPAENRAFQNRLRHLLKHKRYPQPGPGPNYPWPPV